MPGLLLTVASDIRGLNIDYADARYNIAFFILLSSHAWNRSANQKVALPDNYSQASSEYQIIIYMIFYWKYVQLFLFIETELRQFTRLYHV